MRMSVCNFKNPNLYVFFREMGQKMLQWNLSLLKECRFKKITISDWVIFFSNFRENQVFLELYRPLLRTSCPPKPSKGWACPPLIRLGGLAPLRVWVIPPFPPNLFFTADCWGYVYDPGSMDQKEIHLTRPALPYEYTCFADGIPFV